MRTYFCKDCDETKNLNRPYICECGYQFSLSSVKTETILMRKNPLGHRTDIELNSITMDESMSKMRDNRYGE
ncbi:hypothetical protein HN682_00655 [Candidatus Peregrinibacteria bacterium]|jgi:hypothetical protein|nr:hypothetical protein [Candidatus Peregrinibacteria bacterium]